MSFIQRFHAVVNHSQEKATFSRKSCSFSWG